MVGAVASMVKRTIVSMPLTPRSMMRERPPVRRSRWKRSDSSMQMHEGAEREDAHRILADARKQRVAQLAEAALHDADDIVGDHQHHRREHEGRQAAAAS